MKNVTIFLRTALFCAGPAQHAQVQPHVPIGATIIEAEILDQPATGLLIRVGRLLDSNGKELAKTPIVLLLPWGKVDHLLVNDS